MKIYRCKELLRLPVIGKDGQQCDEISITTDMVFTAEDGQGNVVKLEGLWGQRLSVSRQTLEKHFDELA